MSDQDALNEAQDTLDSASAIITDIETALVQLKAKIEDTTHSLESLRDPILESEADEWASENDTDDDDRDENEEA